MKIKLKWIFYQKGTNLYYKENTCSDSEGADQKRTARYETQRITHPNNIGPEHFKRFLQEPNVKMPLDI